jgi:serine/threonine kinase PknH
VDGTPFGRYRLIRLLRRGGMGEVWLAFDTGMKRTVAVKVLPASFADDKRFVQRFTREAEAAARVNNPHIIPIHNYGEIDGRFYVDMRFVEGSDLDEVLADGPLEPQRAVRIIEDVAKGLHAAHKVGLTHRDVKPSNILLDEDDFAYLIDFGIARAADETRLTGTGVAPGTLSYMAPERLRENPHEDDARVDIYALACVLYECLTGRPPFTGSHASLIAAHLNSPPPRPSTTQPNLRTQIDRVIARGMAKDPARRYATTKELAQAARIALNSATQHPGSPQPAPVDGGPAHAQSSVAVDPNASTRAAPELPLIGGAHRGAGEKSEPQASEKQLEPARKAGGRRAAGAGPQGEQIPAPKAKKPRGVADDTERPLLVPLVERLSPRGKLALGVVIGVVILAIVFSIFIFATYAQSLHQPRSPTSATSTSALTATSTSGPIVSSAPVEAALLPGLLLNPAAVNSVMHTGGMTVGDSGTINNFWANAGIADKNCAAVVVPAVAAVYAGTTWTAMAGRELNDSSTGAFVSQNVVRFATPADANAFYAASSPSWSACSNRRISATFSNGSQEWSAGAVTNQNGILTSSASAVENPGLALQRALTVKNDVVIDVSTTSYSPSSQLAAQLAAQIAAKVPE